MPNDYFWGSYGYKPNEKLVTYSQVEDLKFDPHSVAPYTCNEVDSFFEERFHTQGSLVGPLTNKRVDDNGGNNDFYRKQYLTTEALEDGTISFNIYSTMGIEYITSISYSTDNGNSWTTVNNVDDKEENLVISVNVSQGDKILWKGDAQQTGYDGGASFFSSDCEFNVYGNIMSLLHGDDFSDRIELEYEYQLSNLFSDWDEVELCKVVDASNLILPATTLAQGCYQYMFYNCTSLTTAPVLPATTLALECYNSMFQGCTSLNYIKCLATDISATDCTYDWVSNVAASGTFVKADSMSSWTTGNDGIPSGWTVEDA